MLYLSNSNSASIHAANQQAFIQSNLPEKESGNTWIGFRDYGKNGEFQWSDDSRRDFSNWAPGEPNNPIGGNQPCVEMYPDGHWNDDDCAKGQTFVCQFDRNVENLHCLVTFLILMKNLCSF